MTGIVIVQWRICRVWCHNSSVLRGLAITIGGLSGNYLLWKWHFHTSSLEGNFCIILTLTFAGASEVND